MKSLVLGLICLFAYRVRLFMITKYEPVLHQFNSYRHLRQLKRFINDDYQFDEMVNYPHGEVDATNVGFVVTAAGLHKVFSILDFTSSIEESCIYFAPVIACFTSLFAYLLGGEIVSSEVGALLTSVLMALIPGYLAQSNGGTFDVESVAIMMMVLMFYFFVRAIKKGSMVDSVLAAGVYGSLSVTWEQYSLVGNMLALFVLLVILSNNFSLRCYVAYSTFYCLCALCTLSVSIMSLDDLLPLFTFLFLQLYCLADFTRGKMSSSSYSHFLVTVLGTLVTSVVLLVLLAMPSLPGGEISALFADLNSVRASQSGAQSSSWAAFFVDCHVTLMLAPVGINLCLAELNDAKLFLLTYLFAGLYCSALQEKEVSALVWLSPALCIISGLVLSHYIKSFMPEKNQPVGQLTKRQRDLAREVERTYPNRGAVKIIVITLVGLTLASTALHANWAASKSYNDPTLFLTATNKDGSVFIFDDFRESYSWLAENTPQNAKVLAWKDHGFQLNELANRTTIVDGKSEENAKIVADIFTSSEEEAHEKLLRLNVDYVMVTFGGMVTYGSDDIAKFLWMSRIAQKDENDFKNENGEFRVDSEASPKWMKTILYKMCYYRYGQMSIDSGRPTGWDRVRRAEVGDKDYALDVLEEVFTSTHWLIRVFKVKRPDNLGNPLVL